MKAEEIELRYKLSNNSDEELLMIVGVKSNDYRKEVLDYAMEELTRRGIPFSAAGEYGMEELTRRGIPFSPDGEIALRVMNEPGLKGVEGWLFFLCLRLTIITPTFFVLSILATGSINIYAAAFSPAPITTTVLILIDIFPVCFGIYAGIALWAIKPNAVKIAKISHIIFMVYNLIVILVILLVKIPQSQPDNYFTSFPMHILILVGNILWYIYLSSSERVKITYAKEIIVQDNR
jgi:hypothetical protein